MHVTHLFEHAGGAVPVMAGTRIFREGDARDNMYAVVDGEIDLWVGDRHVETVGPGGLFGEMALIEKSNRVATAVARTDAKIVPVNEQRFLFLIQQTPHFALHVMRVLSDRLRRMDERLASS